MPKYKLIIAYDGTDYHGWQSQPSKPTIAGTLEASFETAFSTTTSIVGVSRTDTGVHALGQVGSTITNLEIDAQRLAFAWNNLLPKSIQIIACQRVADTYTPFANIVEKTYHYQFCLHRPLPALSRYCLHIPRPVDLDLLEQALQIFVGTHDFRAFSTGDDRGDDTIRTIESISTKHDDTHNSFIIVIKGPKFLRYMVRRIVGAAFDVASRKQFTVDSLHKALLSKDPNQRFVTAPAHGLTLYNVRYKEEKDDSTIK